MADNKYIFNMLFLLKITVNNSLNLNNYFLSKTLVMFIMKMSYCEGNEILIIVRISAKAEWTSTKSDVEGILALGERLDWLGDVQSFLILFLQF